MPVPDLLRLAVRMIITYVLVHVGMTLVTMRTENALGLRQHLTAVNWALPSLLQHFADHGGRQAAS